MSFTHHMNLIPCVISMVPKLVELKEISTNNNNKCVRKSIGEYDINIAPTF